MAAISVQQGGGGDYTTLEAAVENASTVDGDVITISGTWTIREDTRIAVADALTIVATGDSKQIARPWRSGDTHYQHRSTSNTSGNHSFTITDAGAVTFEDIDIIHDGTGVSNEMFRNNIANTFVARRCVLGFGVAGGTDQQDLLYTETTANVTFENCIFYNVYRGVVDMTGTTPGTININSCTAYAMGFSNSETSRSGLVGKNTSSAVTINIFNTLCFMTNLNHQVCTNSTSANTTANVERLVTNSTQAPVILAPATTSYAGNVEDAVINATDTLGNYIVTSITNPYDLTLLDSANNAAIGAHSDGTGGGLTMPSTDILGTTRTAPYDIGAFTVAASGAFTLTAASGGYTYSGAEAALAAGKILSTDSGGYAYSGAAAALSPGFSLSADSGSYTYSGTAAGLTKSALLTADSGAYSYNGTNAGVLFGASLAADSGAYAYTGTAATLTFASAGNFTLVGESGAYSYSGTIAALTADRVLVGLSGGYAYSGTAAALSKGFSLAADSGAYSYLGTNIDFSNNAVLNALSGNYVYNGTNVSLLYTPIGPDIPTADGLTVSGTFGNGVSFTASFGNGVAVKGKL
jgi:hypothetical protein